jgi:hypothetical protein
VHHWVIRNHQLLSARDASELLYVLAIHESGANQEGGGQQGSSHPSNLSNESTSEVIHDALRGGQVYLTNREVYLDLEEHATADAALEEVLGARSQPFTSDGGQAAIDRTMDQALIWLSQVIARNLHQCSPQQVVGVVWALARLGKPETSGILSRVLKSLRASHPQHKPAVDEGMPRSIVAVASRRGSKGPTPGMSGVTLPLQTQELLPLAALNPEDVARLCWAIAQTWRLQAGRSQAADVPFAKDPMVLELLEREAIEWCPSMDNQVCQSGHAY